VVTLPRLRLAVPRATWKLIVLPITGTPFDNNRVVSETSTVAPFAAHTLGAKNDRSVAEDVPLTDVCTNFAGE
jgi:hypothetical protein